MKTLIELPGFSHAIVVTKLRSSDKPDEDGFVTAKNQLDDIRGYGTKYNNYGDPIGVEVRIFSKDLIVKLYEALMEVERLPAQKTHRDNTDNDLPF